jgi:hypothetical protein
MRKAFGFVILVLLAGCSQADRHGPPSGSADNQAESAAGPDVSPTAAPGVAFNYRYLFRLPAGRIGAVQEAHAQACEKIGPARCRVTGMSFHRTSDEDVEARLDLKLDPALARAFGRQGVDAVVHADGVLAEAEISGEDEGRAIAAASRDEGQQEGALKTAEAQLARPGLGSAERTQLQAQVQEAREAVRASRSDRSDKQDLLAATPMTFAYASGDMAPGFNRSLSTGFGNLVDALQWMLLAAITLAPWLLLALLIWGLIRRFSPQAIPEV